MNNQTKSITVRNTTLTLNTYNRSLDLCARMNYETEILDFIDSLSPNDTLYDLGAAEGRFALYAALKGIPVHAFEPENNNFQVLNDNIKLNADAEKNIKTYNLAIGEKDQASTINIGQPWPGGHQKIVATAPGRVDLTSTFHTEQPITIVALDNFIQKSGVSFPTALKVDIDGSEIPFIRGAKKTLSDPRQKKLIFELCVIDEGYSEVMEFLTSLGYTEQSRFGIPNEPHLFNILFTKP